jgi:SAM-dependent methyltransferase
MSGFDARGYWENRLAERFTLDGVGWTGLGTAFNGWMYRVRRHVFLRSLRRYAPRPETLRVLDVGSGTGFYVERWHELGVAHVTGTDLTDTAVSRLRERHPGDRFERFDVGSTDLPFDPGSFDAISIVDVLFHIVDDEDFRQAFRNAYELLAPGGLLVFTENFLHGPTQRAEHQVSRSLGEIEAAVAEAGFETLARRPMFVLLNTPLDTGSRLLRAWWKFVLETVGRANPLGAVVGAVAYPFELVLVGRVHDGPSTELMVCRRPAA